MPRRAIIVRYSLTDEQALLAKVRYNRLVDIFTGVTCYSLQNHLRTTVSEIGQIETDEIYVGVDRRGAQYVFPVQAKGRTTSSISSRSSRISLYALKSSPTLSVAPSPRISWRTPLLLSLALNSMKIGVALTDERHYRLVEPDQCRQRTCKPIVTDPLPSQCPSSHFLIVSKRVDGVEEVFVIRRGRIR